jgi:hypothetical protein
MAMGSPTDLTTLLERLVAARRRHRPPADSGKRGSPAGAAGGGGGAVSGALGPLDVLGTIEEERAYDDLLADSVSLSLDGAAVRALSLEAIVQLKRRSSHPKDRMMLPVLEATLRRMPGR